MPHTLHDVAPGPGVLLPVPHAMHADIPDALVNVPVLQRVHILEDCVLENEPAGQISHTVASAFDEYVPASQATHEPLLLPLIKVPGGHDMQEVIPTSIGLKIVHLHCSLSQLMWLQWQCHMCLQHSGCMQSP